MVGAPDMSPKVETPKVEERVERGSDLYLEWLAFEFLKTYHGAYRPLYADFYDDYLYRARYIPVLLLSREDLRKLGKVLELLGFELPKDSEFVRSREGVTVYTLDVDGYTEDMPKILITFKTPEYVADHFIDALKVSAPFVTVESEPAFLVIEGEGATEVEVPDGTLLHVSMSVSGVISDTPEFKDASKLLKATIESYQDAFEKVESAISDLEDTLKLLDDIYMYLGRFDVEDQPKESSFKQALAMSVVLEPYPQQLKLRHILTGEGPQGYVPADLPSIERFMATVSEFYKLLYALSRKLRPLTDSREIKETMTRASERLAERDILAFPTIFLEGDRS